MLFLIGYPYGQTRQDFKLINDFYPRPEISEVGCSKHEINISFTMNKAKQLLLVTINYSLLF